MSILSEEGIKQKVYNNSLQTCEYISGYENYQSVIKVHCLIHNLEFETRYDNIRRDNRKHHICPQCQKEDRNSSKVKCECSYCHQKFFRAASKINNSKSSLIFCCREHKDLAQRIESGLAFQKIRPFHYDLADGKNYREKAFRFYEHKCAICNWNEDIDCLEVHHIDENRENNDIENLIILCPLCHKKLTTHKYALIDKKSIQKIT